LKIPDWSRFLLENQILSRCTREWYKTGGNQYREFFPGFSVSILGDPFQLGQKNSNLLFSPDDIGVETVKFLSRER